MKNKFKFLATMLIGILLSTNVWGESYVFKKLTADPSDWNGTYLIVSGSKALQGSNPGDANQINVEDVDGEITLTSLNDAFEIAYVNGSGYSVKGVGSSNYIKEGSSSGSFATSNTAVYHTAISYNSLKQSSYYLRYNASKFRYYTSSSQGNGIVFYKLDEGPATPCTVTFEAGTGRCSTTSLTEASAGAGVILPTAQASVGCAAVGWTFAGWATASQTETTTAPTLYAAGSNYKPSANCTLYAVYSLTPEIPAGAAPVGTVLWSEDWSDSSPLDKYNTSDFSGSIQNANLAGGQASPELLLAQYKSLTTTAAIDLRGAKTLEATLYSNRDYIRINGNKGTNVEGKLYRYKWTVEDAVTSLNVTIASNGSDNARVDDITLKVAAPDAKYNSNPECAAPVRISWKVQSDQYAEDEINTQVTIVPANPDPAAYSCGENAVFVGWTTSDNYSNHSIAPTPLYKTAAEIKALVLTEDITFYAVFATKVIN